MKRVQKLFTTTYALATGKRADSEEAVVRVFAIFGQILVFRMARATVERSLGWEGYGAKEVAVIRAMLHEHLDALINAEARR